MSDTGLIPGGLPVELRVHAVERAFDLLGDVGPNWTPAYFD